VRGGVQKRVVAPSAGGRNPKAGGGRFLPGFGCNDIDLTMAPTTGVNNNVEVQPVMAIVADPVRAAAVFLGLRHMPVMLQIPRLQWCFPSLTTPLRPWKMWTMLTCFAVVRI